MHYRISFLFSIIILAILIINSTAISAEREDIYHSGKKAFESKNYVVALKNLYAFYIINELSLEKHKEFKNNILEKIATCESMLTLALATNKTVNLEQGKVVFKSTEIKGGFTGTGMEIQKLLENKSINIDQMMKKRQGNALE